MSARLTHGYTVLVIRDDKVECGALEIPVDQPLPSLGSVSAAVLESIRRGEDQAKKAAGRLPADYNPGARAEELGRG